MTLILPLRLPLARAALVVWVAFATAAAAGQTPPNPDYVRTPVFDTYDEFRTALDAAANLSDSTARDAALDDLFGMLASAGQIPFAIGDKAAFLYRGNAGTVAWPGDYNGWNPATPGTRIGQSDVWISEQTFPPDARTEYKVFVNGAWKLDPLNPLEQWGGFGPNSELRMPQYQFPRETIRQPGVPQGAISPNIRIRSQRLMDDLNYRVYTPPGYEGENLDQLPTVYVTDGHEYLADYLGAMPIVLDNLIATGEIRPTIAVFIDPRDPDTGRNRRQELYLGAPDFKFIQFIADELIPVVDQAYRTSPRPEDRTMLGTSFGGFFSAVVGAALGNLEPEAYLFQNVVMQSPFLVPELIDIYRDFPLQEMNLWMSGGTLGDDRYSDALALALAESGYSFEYLKVNEGHSWGAWRGQLDDALIAAVGPRQVPEATHATLMLMTLATLMLCHRVRVASYAP